MLQFMRQRASSWMIKAILSIIVLAFIFMGVGNFGDREEVPAAVVNGEAISATQFQDRYFLLLDNARRQLGNQLNDEILKMMDLKGQAMEQLISETLLLQKADELGFKISDRELSDHIRRLPFFHQDGQFNKALYNNVLQRNRLTPEMFEQLQRRELLTQKVRGLIEDGVKVSDDEIRRWYDWQNAEVKIKATVFNPDDFVQVTASDEALAQYFEENREQYTTQEKTQITYIVFDPDDFVSEVAVTDDEIRQYYDDNRETYSTEKTVEASHILLRVAADAPETTVAARQAEAVKIYDLINAGRDFADCAREYSEDTASAAKGGALGPFKKQELVAPFAEQAFAMKAGEISRPVRTQFGWHIIRVDKVNEASEKSLAEVRADIEKLLARRQARNLAYDAALEAFDTAVDKSDLDQTAAALGLKSRTTPFFSRTDKLDGVVDGAALIQQSFDLPEGEISDVVEAGGRYYLFRVDKRQAPEVPELKAVKERVTADLTAQLRKEAAREAAEDLLATIRQGTAFDEAAAAAKAAVITTDFFERGANVPELDNEPLLTREAFQLGGDNRLADKVLEGKKGYYVIYLEDRRLPVTDTFADEKGEIEKQLLRIKKEEAVTAWISALKTDSEITRDERFLK